MTHLTDTIVMLYEASDLRKSSIGRKSDGWIFESTQDPYDTVWSDHALLPDAYAQLKKERPNAILRGPFMARLAEKTK
jgi:hypothetical protein